jgi:hypothetical protein
MATYAQEKAARQRLLRDVKVEQRKLDSQVQILERVLVRKRSARTLLDSADILEVASAIQNIVTQVTSLQRALIALQRYSA